MDYSQYFPEIGQEIWHFSCAKRLMPLAKLLVEKLPSTANGRILKADKLICAKGRFERNWYAEKGGLWIALSIYDDFFSHHSPFISLIFGLAMLRCAHHFGIKEAKIKWINDLHYKGKKLGGVLIEKYKDWYIAGVGININNPLPKNIPALSFKEILKKEIPLTKVLEIFIYWLRYYFGFLRIYENKLLEEAPISNIILEDFKKFSDTLGRCIAYAYNLDTDEYLIGKAVDIDETGALGIEITKNNPSQKTDIIYVDSGEILIIL